ncbi:MAG: preprotein translocase subunit YajC [Acidimicrobiia bacterium]|nr:preprotein translocase subunit YajC [bacterium]MXW58765.1 preprotein translocase subunit YajC [Acidimicrobiia bacterium]MDE0612960.1 preprotein translocase subunit YajC [bacterium]MXZ79594.1 preprotein translocase subunit YajC [Acidimicrobiia bacterium]MXZ85500.1 preprotein translocase subunit YajC [Acidimicrobiia bacterium]
MDFIFLIALMFVAMYFFMVRPQQRKARQHRELIESLDVGDEVITASGLYGMITDFDGGTVFIEISDGVEIKISRDTIANKVVYAAEVDEDDEGQGPLMSGD